MKKILLFLILLCFKVNACDLYVIEENGEVLALKSGDPFRCDIDEISVLTARYNYCTNPNMNLELKEKTKDSCSQIIIDYKNKMTEIDEEIESGSHSFLYILLKVILVMFVIFYLKKNSE